LKLLEIKLAGTDYYPQLFADAYPSTPYITKDNISDALTAFLRSMITWNSRFDQGMQSNFSNFTAEELRGKEIFMGNAKGPNIDPFGNVIDNGACAGCHAAPMFNDGGSERSISAYDDNDTGNGRGVNIGLDKVSKDKGTGDGSFKIPSLRNIELTGPYMHDGRFKTLEEVVDHYNEKIQPAANLHRKLKDNNGKPKRFNFTDADKKALVAFMKTLTDKSFTSDPRFADPFAK
jgi:cytochrome c peroxidase